jgi:hypothetical protein
LCIQFGKLGEAASHPLLCHSVGFPMRCKREVVVHTGNHRIDDPLAGHLICGMPPSIGAKDEFMRKLSRLSIPVELADDLSKPRLVLLA